MRFVTTSRNVISTLWREKLSKRQRNSITRCGVWSVSGAIQISFIPTALLRELEAGRALAAYARNVRLMLPYVPENDRAVYEALETALADYDAARGANVVARW